MINCSYSLESQVSVTLTTLRLGPLRVTQEMADYKSETKSAKFQNFLHILILQLKKKFLFDACPEICQNCPEI